MDNKVNNKLTPSLLGGKIIHLFVYIITMVKRV